MFYVGSTFVRCTIIDPVSGAGAYKIGGGENGGILTNLKKGFQNLIMRLMFLAGAISSLQKSNIFARFIVKSLGLVGATSADFLKFGRTVVAGSQCTYPSSHC